MWKPDRWWSKILNSLNGSFRNDIRVEVHVKPATPFDRKSIISSWTDDDVALIEDTMAQSTGPPRVTPQKNDVLDTRQRREMFETSSGRR